MSNTCEKVCRLCLKIICNNNFNTIEDVTMQMFAGILVKVELNENKEDVMCSECAAKLQESFDFKLACISLNHKHLISTKGDLKLNSAKVSSIESRNDALDDRKSCRFCARRTETDSCIYLNETKENIPIVDMLQQHMPELELNISEELVTCEDCLKSLQHFLSFTKISSYTKQEVKDYSRTEVVDDKSKIIVDGQVPLILVNYINTNAANLMKTEELVAKIEENFTVKTEIKNENMEIGSWDVSKDEEETGPMSEHSNNESNQNATTSHTETLHKCSRCPFETQNRSKLRSHLVTHQNALEVMLYKCNYCSFETEGRSQLEEHTLMHKATLEATGFKSDPPAFDTKLKRRTEKHKNGSQAELHSCPICSRKFTQAKNLSKHQLLHQKPSDTTMYRCEQCTYHSRYKYLVKRHMLVHASLPKTPTYEYEHCPLKAKYKKVIIVHALKKNNPTETKQNSCLQEQIGTYKASSEITVFKCDTCEFKTEHKTAFEKHMLKQTGHSQRKMYNCPICSRECKRKKSVTAHMLLHQNPSEVKMYKCELCTFETKYKGYVKRHMRTHAMSETTVYRCEKCQFVSKYERVLNAHMQIHEAVRNADLFSRIYFAK